MLKGTSAVLLAQTLIAPNGGGGGFTVLLISPAESSREALTEAAVADVLMLQLKRAADAERRHVILEILGSLGESGKTGFSGHRAGGGGQGDGGRTWVWDQGSAHSDAPGWTTAPTLLSWWADDKQVGVLQAWCRTCGRAPP